LVNFIGDKLAAFGTKVADGTKKAGVYCYDKGVVAVDAVSKKGKEISV